MKEYAKYKGQFDLKRRSYRYYKLSEACKQQRIVVENAHDALGDVFGLYRRAEIENLVDESCFAVVDVGNNGDVFHSVLLLCTAKKWHRDKV